MPEYDDSAEKSRRNLVVFSGGILASAFLQPKLADQAKVLGFVDAKDIEPIRLWLVVTLVLFYMAFRYWFSEPRKRAYAVWVKERDRRARAALAERLVVELRRHFENRSYIPTIIPKVTNIKSDNSDVSLTFQGLSLVKDEFALQGFVRCWVISSGYAVAPDEQEVDYDVTDVHGRASFLKHAVAAGVMSESAHELFVPWLLAGASLIVCLTALWRHF
ncbi:hypothetical protein [Cupriavidus taiwanensis]|uniref:hypothetical protein n=1 Tax=Cupriavidus taiwanensis TaxID=164546 RepID=UPI000470E82C|nr:hypothetical protein [Cupriavidus taiwanensis]SOZ12098.1 conserved membrane protein of unknown function [Cupriavidus taiwanensis]